MHISRVYPLRPQDYISAAVQRNKCVEYRDVGFTDTVVPCELGKSSNYEKVANSLNKGLYGLAPQRDRVQARPWPTGFIS